MEALLLLVTATSPPLIRPTSWTAADDFNWDSSVPVPRGQGSRDGVFVIPNSVDGVLFTCSAKYPIEWAFHHSQLPSHAVQRSSRGRWYVVVSTTRKSGDNLDDIASFEYLAEIRLMGSSTGMTGNYTCQKVGDESVASSAYIYWEANAPPFLVQQGQNGTAILDPVTNTTLIPCTVARPSILVELFKRYNTVNASGWTPIPKNNSVTYDPQRGFTLKNLTDVIGEYKCIANSEPKDFATIHVIPTSSPEAKPLEFGDLVRRPASFGYDKDSGSMYCCSRSTAPAMMHFSCDHPIFCRNRKNALLNMENTAKHNESCASLRLFVPNAGVFRCKGDGIDIVREYFFPMGSLFSFGRPFGMSTNRSDYPYFTWESADASKMISLRQWSNKVYRGQNVTYGCQTSSYFFSRGVRWVLGFANGTEIHVKEALRNETRSGFTQWFRRNIVSLVVNVDRNLKSVSCYAPVWNSSEWKIQTLQVKVWKPLIPVIVPAASSNLEILEWYLNDTNKIIDCNASGDPLPSISWMKDGKRNFRFNTITLNTTSNATVVSSRLNISRTSHDTQGVYVCIALNLRGSVNRTFQVYVYEHGSPGTTVAIVLSVACLALCFGGIVYLALRVKKQNVMMQTLVATTFKEVVAVEGTIPPFTGLENRSASISNEKGNGWTNQPFNFPQAPPVAVSTDASKEKEDGAYHRIN